MTANSSHGDDWVVYFNAVCSLNASGRSYHLTVSEG
jgi:hypothetical protein